MPIAILVVMCLIAGLLTERFLSPINLTNILLQASVMAIVAMGMTFVVVSGGFDLSVGSTVALAGCVATWVITKAGVTLGLAAGMAVGAGVGLINGFCVAKLRISPFITTLGTMVVMRGFALLMTDGRPIVGDDDGFPNLFLALGRDKLFGVQILILVPIVLFFALYWLLHMTAYGRRVFASGGGSEASFLAGIKVDRITMSAYVWCGLLAGVAGFMLASRLQSGQPTAGEFYELTAIAAVVLGGASLSGGEGSLVKSVIGVFIMVVLANALNLLNVHSYWQRIAVGVVIIAAAAADQIRTRRR